MTKKRIADPQRHARERLWAKFNKHGGPYTQLVTSHAPLQVRLSLVDRPDIECEGWLGDFNDNLLSLHHVRGGAWILVSECNDRCDPALDGPVAHIAITGNDPENVARAISIVESQGMSAEDWAVRLVGDRGA